MSDDAPITLVHQIARHARERADQPAFYRQGADGWTALTWSEANTAIREIAKGLLALGHEVGECVAIVGANRVEWVLCQHAIAAIGGICAPGYPTNTTEQVAHILHNSGARIAIADTAALVDGYRKARDLRPDDVSIEHLVVMLDEEVEGAGEGVTAVSALRERGREQPDDELDARLGALTEDTVCLLIYTSGTTGVSKGVMLDHGNVSALQQAVIAEIPAFASGEQPFVAVSYLPLCHIAEQALTNFVGIGLAGQIWFCPDLKAIRDYLVEARPTCFVGVPRVWEKFQAALEARLAEANPIRRGLARWAMGVELAAVEKEIATGQPTGGLLRGLAGRVLGRIRGALGLDRIQLAATGAAPIATSTLRFFASLGILVHEVYGMSETTAVATMNPIGRPRFGTVGRAVGPVEVRIAEDGEVLLRGRTMTRGYRNMPEKTAELLDDEGWLHTGDLGTLDDDGFLSITGRKKDILITAGGKNVAPAEMEGHVLGITGVGQVVVVGDRQPYLSALIALDPENLEALAAAVGVPAADTATLAADPKVKAWLMEQVESECNAKVARYQTLKKIAVLPNELTVEGGELTPTMKVKRNVVNDKYADVIAGLYA